MEVVLSVLLTTTSACIALAHRSLIRCPGVVACVAGVRGGIPFKIVST